jgi:4-hydroxybutyrate CoA-transferase
MLNQGAGVVTTRNHVRYVVTEYGVADLYGLTIRQRAKCLIQIAHPEFREDLTRMARDLQYFQ